MDEFNYYISEYFETPPPAVNVLNALAVLMRWSGDSKQIVTKMTGQRHTEDKKYPDRFSDFLTKLKEANLAGLSDGEKGQFRCLMTDQVAWQKFDHEKEKYNEQTP